MNSEPKLYPDGVWARPIDKEKDVRTKGDEWKATNEPWVPCGGPFGGRGDFPAKTYEYRRPVPAPERRKDAVEQGVTAAATPPCPVCGRVPAYDRMGWISCDNPSCQGANQDFSIFQWRNFDRRHLVDPSPPEQGHEPWPGTPGAQNEDTARRLIDDAIGCIQAFRFIRPKPSKDISGEVVERLRSFRATLATLAARGVQPAAEQEFPVLTNPPDGSYTMAKCEQCKAWRVQPAAQELDAQKHPLIAAALAEFQAEIPQEGAPAAEQGWAAETMRISNKLTPDIKGKAFDPEWFLLRQRLEALEQQSISSPAQEKRETAEEIRRFRELLSETLPFVDGFNGRYLNRRIREALVATASPEEKV